MISKDIIIDLLRKINHPEKQQDIVSLGMIDSLEVSENGIKFFINSLRVRDPFSASLKKLAEQLIVATYPEFASKVTIFVKEPAPAPKKEKQPSVKLECKGNIIAISSGKGGVGKSTVAANIAVTLADMGYSVGLLDADIYGPSMPKMFNLEDFVPTGVDENGKEMLIPAHSHGVKVMSIGFFIKPSDALVWRAPMATNALRQLIHQTQWGELDFMLIDLPPGTGDVHLTMIQEMALTGAIIVSTPQEVALADVVRGISMFRGEHINVPILGLVENMAWFTPAELPQNKHYIFGKEGCKHLAQKENIPLLTQIPLVQSACEGGDNGVPDSLNNDILKQVFHELIQNMIENINNNKR